VTALLEVEGLRVEYGNPDGSVTRSVDGVSLRVQRGEIAAILGESGCGKSTTALAILRLIAPPGRIAAGSIRLQGRDLLALSETEMRRVRGAEVSMVFQNPLTYLNPVRSIGDQIAEVLRAPGHGKGKREALTLARQALEDVRIADPDRVMQAYPHELSGGMNQRVLIAIAIVGRPSLVVLDEPTTALDVTVQREITLLIRDLRDRLGMSMLFITHDFGLAADLADRVHVMYAGRVVEDGAVRDLFRAPAHPYTRALVDSVLSVRVTRHRLASIPGSVPDLRRPIPGCAFAPRCGASLPRCATEPPPVVPLNTGSVRCWLQA
jgi:peptide/nickel transport system ATP-binding protein